MRLRGYAFVVLGFSLTLHVAGVTDLIAATGGREDPAAGFAAAAIVRDSLALLPWTLLAGLIQGFLAWPVWRLLLRWRPMAAISSRGAGGALVVLLAQVLLGFLVTPLLVLSSPEFEPGRRLLVGPFGRGPSWAAILSIPALLMLVALTLACLRRTVDRAMSWTPRRRALLAAAIGAGLGGLGGLIALLLIRGRVHVAPRPNVVLVLADGLSRADLDRLDTGDPASFEHLRRLADRSVRFDNHYTVSTGRLESLVSVLTGQHPAEHGIRCDLPGGAALRRVMESTPSLAEPFADSGYETLLAGDAAVDRFAAMARGFESIIGAAVDSPRSRLRRAVLLHQPLLCFWGRNLIGEACVPGMILVTRTPARLGGHLVRRFADAAGAGRPFFGVLALATGARSVPQRIDQALAPILDWIDAKGLREHTYLALVSLRGDDADRLSFAPDPAREDVARVPFLLAGPDAGEARHLDPLVRSVDVGSTLLELCGLAFEPAGRRSGGYSLAPILIGAAGDPHLPLFLEAGGSLPIEPNSIDADAVGTLGDELVADLARDKVRVLRNARWKMVRRRGPEGVRHEVYDTFVDGDETTNLAGLGLAPERELEAVMHAWIDFGRVSPWIGSAADSY